MKRVRLLIRGKVQGVFYRVSTREQARQMGIVGWVKNLPDGSVECIAQGPESILRDFIAWHAANPGLSTVHEIREEWDEPEQELTGFEIVYQ